MAIRIVEFFGYSPEDQTEVARMARAQEFCPFLKINCLKNLTGACTLKPARSGPVICCPYRLYADDYKVLADVASIAFGPNCLLIRGDNIKNAVCETGKVKVAVFGKRWGKELRLPNRGGVGGYFVDWVLAKLDDKGDLAEFVAVEVQSIDTTGNYNAEREAYLRHEYFSDGSKAGFNWENVNKRILPQLIYKGHVLRRERLCKSGMFFICPKPVYEKIHERLGGNLYEYQLQTGALTLMWYDLGAEVQPGQIRELKLCGTFTTTVDQVATAFTSPSNLPDANVYENAIRENLK